MHHKEKSSCLIEETVRFHRFVEINSDFQIELALSQLETQIVGGSFNKDVEIWLEVTVRRLNSNYVRMIEKHALRSREIVMPFLRHPPYYIVLDTGTTKVNLRGV